MYRNTKRIILPLVSFVILLQSFTGIAGDIEREKFEFGLTLQRIFPQGDFGTYWSDAFGYGLTARYEVENSIYLKVSGSVGYFTPSTYELQSRIPNIYLINLTAGLHMIYPIASTVNTVFGAGIDNFTFIFRGEAAQRVASNYIESEIGMHADGGISLKTGYIPETEISVRYGIIFSLPKLIQLVRINCVVYI